MTIKKINTLYVRRANRAYKLHLPLLYIVFKQ